MLMSLVTTRLKGKPNHYRSKVEDFRLTNPAKWFKSIYVLLGADNLSKTLEIPSDDDVLELVYELQMAFRKPMANLSINRVMVVNLVDHLLKNTSPSLVKYVDLKPS